MVNYEKQRQEMMAKQQAKIEAVERRAAEMRRKRAEKDVAWKQQQRQKELDRVRRHTVSVLELFLVERIARFGRSVEARSAVTLSARARTRKS